MNYEILNIPAPKLKGRPRKRKPRQTTGVGSPAESEASSESSASTSVSISAPKVRLNYFSIVQFYQFKNAVNRIFIEKKTCHFCFSVVSKWNQEGSITTTKPKKHKRRT